MSINKISYNFFTKESCLAAIDLFGADSFDKIDLYKDGNKFNSFSYKSYCAAQGDSKAKKDIREFFKNGGEFIHLIRK